ncbi:MAG: nitroreductase family protein [Syntrophomonadales bacterium]
MDALELVKARRSIRKFKADPIPDQVVNEILEAASWAPSHRNSQPWEFAVIGPRTRSQS